MTTGEPRQALPQTNASSGWGDEEVGLKEAKHQALTKVHAVFVVALQESQKQLTQRSRGLPGDAGQGKRRWG